MIILDSTGKPAAGNPPSALMERTDFLTAKLDDARDYMSRVFAPHKLTFQGQGQDLNFRHAQAALRKISFNSVRYGAEVTCSSRR